MGMVIKVSERRRRKMVRTASVECWEGAREEEDGKSISEESSKDPDEGKMLTTKNVGSFNRSVEKSCTFKAYT